MHEHMSDVCVGILARDPLSTCTRSFVNLCQQAHACTQPDWAITLSKSDGIQPQREDVRLDSEQRVLSVDVH